MKNTRKPSYFLLRWFSKRMKALDN